MYKELFEQAGELFSYGANDQEKIDQISKYLNREIPNQFKQFLIEIGAGGNAYIDVYGTGKHPSGKAAFIAVNERKGDIDKELPEDYYLIMDIGDDVSWYLDFSSLNQDGEPKVIGWISGLKKEEQPEWVKEQETYDCFYDFVKCKLEAAD